MTQAFGLQESVFTIRRTNRQTDTLTPYASITGACDRVLRIPHCSRFLLPSRPPYEQSLFTVNFTSLRTCVSVRVRERVRERACA